MSAVESHSVAAEGLIVGSGQFRYRVDVGWPRLPSGMDFVEVAAVSTDSRGRVYVFNRGEHPVIVFTPEGEYVAAWGKGEIVRAHGMTIGSDDAVYCVDDFGHCVKKFTTEGKLLHTFGTPGRPSDTGATSIDFRSIQYAGPPFNYPTDLAIARNGELYVTDGYGNARVHRFTPDGELMMSWGEPGNGPGQFHIPHAITIDEEIIYVADRENSRLQLFSLDGEFITAWNDVARPNGVFIDDESNVFIAELGYRAGMWPGTTAPSANPTGGRLSIFNRDGEMLARWGGGDTPCAPGDFFAPHDAWIDSRGDLYVSEVTWSGGGNKGVVPRDCHCVQKFVRVT